MKISWRELKIIDSKALRVAPWDPQALSALDDLRLRSRIDEKHKVSFLKHGFDHEDPSNPWTWGPKDSSVVDWEGFEKVLAEAKERRAHERPSVRRNRPGA